MVGMHESQAELLRTVDPPILGQRIRAAREARGWTQADLAEDGLSPGYLSRIENGVRRPTLKLLHDIALRLDTSVEQLLRGKAATAYDEIRLDLNYAELALESGEAADAESQARRGAERAEEAGFDDLALRGRHLLARALESLGELSQAIRCYETVLASASGVVALRAGVALSRCYRESGDLALAVDVGTRLQSMIKAGGLEHTDEAVRLAVTVAAAHAERGDIAQATRICSDAVDHAEQLTSGQARSGAYWNASILQAQQGDVASALPLAERALALLAEGGDERNVARLRLQLGRLHLKGDRPAVDEAIEHLTVAKERLRSSSASAIDLTLCDVSLAHAHLLGGDPARAADAAAEADRSAPLEALVVRAEALVVAGQAAVALGNPDDARAAYQRATELLTEAGADRSAAQLWFELAELLRESGDVDAACSAFRNAAAASGLQPRAHQIGVATAVVS